MILGGGAVALADALGEEQCPVLLVNAPSHLPVHFLVQMREWNRQPHLPIDLLYSGASDVLLTRTSEQSLELAVERGYFASVFERGERDPNISPLRVGDEIALGRMLVRVLAEHDGMPSRVRFELASPLDHHRPLHRVRFSSSPVAMMRMRTRRLPYAIAGPLLAMCACPRSARAATLALRASSRECCAICSWMVCIASAREASHLLSVS
jgi:hypothetical protein